MIRALTEIFYIYIYIYIYQIYIIYNILYYIYMYIYNVWEKLFVERMNQKKASAEM